MPGRLLAYAKERQRQSSSFFPGLMMRDCTHRCMPPAWIPVIAAGIMTRSMDTRPAADAVRTGMELKGIKVSVTAIPIPMACSPASKEKASGKRRCRSSSGVEGLPHSNCCGPSAGEVEDGKVTVIGLKSMRFPQRFCCSARIIIEVAGNR